MWCPTCRQEVPGLVDEVDGGYGCPRCGAVLLNDAGIDLADERDVSRLQKLKLTEAQAADESPVFEPARTPEAQPVRMTTLRWDAANWELNEKLRHVERVTASARLRRDPPSPPTMGPHMPWSQPYGQPYWQQFQPAGYAAPPYPTNPYAPAPPSPAPSQPPPHYQQNEHHGGGRLFAALVSWLFLGGAVTAFSCGGFLAAWGAVGNRPHLQQLGMPIIMLGVVLMVIGLLPQIFLRRMEELDREAAASHAPPEHAPHFQTQHVESPYQR